MPIKYTAARFQIKFNTFAFACGGRWGKVTETSWEDKMWFKLRTKTIFGDNSRFSNVKLIWNLIDICVLVSSEECTRVLEHVYSESMMRCDGTAEIENAHLKTFHLFSPRSSFYPDVSKYAASIPVHLYSHPDISPPSSPLHLFTHLWIMYVFLLSSSVRSVCLSAGCQLSLSDHQSCPILATSRSIDAPCGDRGPLADY